MKKILLASTVLAAPRAFANAEGKRKPPEITAVSSTIAMPERTNKRGSTSLYPFDALTAAGMSFGVKGKTAKQMSTIVSNANKKRRTVRKDATTGQPVPKIDPATQQPIAGEFEYDVSAHFFAVDADPRKDPDGASVRVFRDL